MVTKQGFNVSYEVLEMGMIKPGGSGVMDDGRPYGASVKFRSIVTSTVDDEKLGQKDIEETMEFKIACDDSEVKTLNMLLRSVKANGQVFTLNGSLPRKYDKNDPYAVTVTQSGSEIIKMFNKDKKAS